MAQASKPSQTHSAPSGCHGHDRRPLVGSRVVSLSTTKLRCIISASHSIYHVLVHCTAQVLPPRPHGCNRMPAVLLRIVSFHCRRNDILLATGLASSGDQHFYVSTQSIAQSVKIVQCPHKKNRMYWFVLSPSCFPSIESLLFSPISNPMQSINKSQSDKAPSLKNELATKLSPLPCQMQHLMEKTICAHTHRGNGGSQAHIFTTYELPYSKIPSEGENMQLTGHQDIQLPPGDLKDNKQDHDKC